jgi:hypothetical protein
MNNLLLYDEQPGENDSVSGYNQWRVEPREAFLTLCRAPR